MTSSLFCVCVCVCCLKVASEGGGGEECGRSLWLSIQREAASFFLSLTNSANSQFAYLWLNSSTASSSLSHTHTILPRELPSEPCLSIKDSSADRNLLYEFTESLHFAHLSTYSLISSTVRSEVVALCFDHKQDLNYTYSTHFFFLFMQTCRLCYPIGYYDPNWYYANTDRKWAQGMRVVLLGRSKAASSMN